MKAKISDTEAVPVFVTVTIFPGLTEFTLSVPNASEVGLRVATEVTPVPVIAMAFEVIPVGRKLRVDVLRPVLVGLKITFILQLAPTTREVAQLLV